MPRVPGDLAAALGRHEPARIAFEALPPDRQEEWVRFVERARTRRGRRRRVEDAVRRLGGWTPALADAAAEEMLEQPPPPGAPPPEREWWPWLLLLALLVVAGLLALYFLTRGGGGEVAVPRVVGLQQAEALRRLNDRGLIARVTRRASDRPRGIVLAQDPAAGTKVDKGDRVRIAVSNAPVRLLVPDVVGLETEKAKQRLVSAGLVPEERQVFSKKRRGTVVAQEPKPGKRATKGETVTIDVSKGRGRTTVPDVVGQSRADAEAALRAADLVPNAVTVASAQPADTVTAQDPAAGEQVDRGTKVRINVSSGPSSSTTTTTSQSASVPDVTGVGQAEAIGRLLDAGLRPRVVYATSDQPDDTVTAQSPGGGASATTGSRVRITVSAGASPTFSRVPDVVGRSERDARSTLEDSGFVVSVFRVAGASGAVVDEQPAAGGRAPDGGRVSIFVGRG